MRTWNLTSGAAKLEKAMKTLKQAVAEANEVWNDDASRRFQETYIVPLEPKVREALDAIHRLDIVLNGAQRDCGSE